LFQKQSQSRRLAKPGGSLQRIPIATSTLEGAIDKRRSMRVHIAMPIVVHGVSGAQAFEETTTTITVSAYGCLMWLRTRVARTDQLSVVNVKTGEELHCVVTYIGKSEGEKTEVATQFLEVSPVFWRIAFPPDNGDPSERKRPTPLKLTPLPPPTRQ
jgi:hypothetical protein